MDETFDQVLLIPECLSSFDQVIYTENDITTGTFDQILFVRIFNNRQIMKPVVEKVLFDQSAPREFIP